MADTSQALLRIFFYGMIAFQEGEQETTALILNPNFALEQKSKADPKKAPSERNCHTHEPLLIADNDCKVSPTSGGGDCNVIGRTPPGFDDPYGSRLDLITDLRSPPDATCGPLPREKALILWPGPTFSTSSSVGNLSLPPDHRPRSKGDLHDHRWILPLIGIDRPIQTEASVFAYINLSLKGPLDKAKPTTATHLQVASCDSLPSTSNSEKTRDVSFRRDLEFHHRQAVAQIAVAHGMVDLTSNADSRTSYLPLCIPCTNKTPSRQQDIHTSTRPESQDRSLMIQQEHKAVQENDDQWTCMRIYPQSKLLQVENHRHTNIIDLFIINLPKVNGCKGLKVKPYHHYHLTLRALGISKAEAERMRINRSWLFWHGDLRRDLYLNTGICHQPHLSKFYATGSSFHPLNPHSLPLCMPIRY